MVYESSFETNNEQAMFNMAISTLQRLHDILREIKMIDSNIMIPKEERQQIKISLVKNFFINSAPLLTPESLEKYRKQIINLKTHSTKVFERKTYTITKFVDDGVDYDPTLNTELDNLLVDMQVDLQKKGHFMPSSDEGGWD